MSELKLHTEQPIIAEKIVIYVAPPGPHCINRLWEWYAAMNMIYIGIALILTPKSLEMGAFKYMLLMGWGVFTPALLWAFYLGVGAMRVVALYLNGRLPVRGAQMRAAGCVAGALIWSAMFLALVRLTEDTGTLSIGMGSWGLAIGCELYSLHRASYDVGYRK